MIICLCTGSTDRDVRRGIDRGAGSVCDLQRCGIGTGCGACHDLLRTMLAQSASSESDPWCRLHAAEQKQPVATA